MTTKDVLILCYLITVVGLLLYALIRIIYEIIVEHFSVKGGLNMFEYTIYNRVLNLTYYVTIEASSKESARNTLILILDMNENSIKKVERIA